MLNHKKTLLVVMEDEDMLSSCERGNDVSVDTASLSMTLSSFSNDTHEAHTTETSLRHRRTTPDDHDDLGSYSDDDDHDYCEYDPKNHDFNDGVLRWCLKHIASCPNSRRRNLWFVLLSLFAYAVCMRSRPESVRRPPGWNLPSRTKTARILEQLKTQPVSRALTIRLKGSRVDLLHRSLDKHAHCSIVTAVKIDWKSPQHIPDTLLDHTSGKVEDYAVSPEVPTEAVFLLDERVALSCHSLERAWNEWQQDPSRMVGFLPVLDDDHQKYHDYALLSEDAALVHRFYLRKSHAPLLSAECQHVALSAWVTALSRHSPIAMSSSSFTVKTTTPDYCQREALQATGLDRLPRSTTLVIGRL